MMKNRIYIKSELTAKLGIPDDLFSKIEQLKLIHPVGITEDKMPLYSEDAVRQIEHIRKLMDLGYGFEEIDKIVKRVGLPKSEIKPGDQGKPDQYLTVGALAEKVGVSPRTIKHWEDKGIIIPEMRSEGGFRLYPNAYIYLCNLIKDLQLFGYSLEEIKEVSGYFRDFLLIKKNPEALPATEIQAKGEAMLRAIDALFEKMTLFKEGISRWEDLLKKNKKEISAVLAKSRKTADHTERKSNA
jgi:DNA-binding transcriptional MerR regulator